MSNEIYPYVLGISCAGVRVRGTSTSDSCVSAPVSTGLNEGGTQGAAGAEKWKQLGEAEFKMKVSVFLLQI